MIYLDNAATTWPKPEIVYETVDACSRRYAANPGRGGHKMAMAAGQILYQTRESLAELFHIEDPNTIAFTFNTTMGINTALIGFLKPGDHVVATQVEHNAVSRPLRYLETQGVRLTVVPCRADMPLDPALLEKALTPATKAIILSHASNVTGVLTPLEAVGDLAYRHGVVLIVDAAQTAGVEPIDVEAMHIGMLAFPGHKGLLGPQGTGGLYVREDIQLTPLYFGGTGSNSAFDVQPDFLPDRLESGTLNTPGLAGLGAGVRFIQKTGLSKIKERELELTDTLARGLAAFPSVRVYGGQRGVAHTAVVSFNIQGLDAGRVAYLLDRDYDIACRAGLHCAPWAHDSIGTLKQGTVRLSPGYFTTDREIELTLSAVADIAQMGGIA